MGSNANIHRAKAARNDEFYTRLEDIEKELSYYKDYFKDKVVYLNCDSERSNFWTYFVDNFEELGLKKIIATHFNSTDPVYKLEYNGTTPVKSQLKGNGDFRSDESIELLKEADVLVTNPPFSLFREYITKLQEYGKKFLVIGPINVAIYKDIFPSIKEERLWIGTSRLSTFYGPNGEVKKAPGIWLTNLRKPKRKFFTGTKLYSKERYPKFDNYDAIYIDRAKNIPVDYHGEMGVPITFLEKINTKQFEIIRHRKGNDGKDLSINGKVIHTRVIIKRL
jgi:hypothetical protein